VLVVAGMHDEAESTPAPTKRTLTSVASDVAGSSPAAPVLGKSLPRSDRLVDAHPIAAAAGLEDVLAPLVFSGDLDQGELPHATDSPAYHRNLSSRQNEDAEPPSSMLVGPRRVAALAPADQLVGASPRLA
jgi:hypothetical protein